ncbi:glycoside hydrolase, partial [Shewanella sp. 0m-11]
GRFSTESKLNINEWQRIAKLFITLKHNVDYHWVTPSQLLAEERQYSALKVQTAAHPISVKKQAKYNVTRWALSGRNDLMLNSLCYQHYDKLNGSTQTSEQQWRALCRLWASDLRTHLTLNRYQDLTRRYPLTTTTSLLANIRAKHTLSNLEKSEYHVQFCQERNTLSITHPKLTLVLNGKRGMSIKSLAFARHNFEPIIGTLPHGFFDHISYAADFYSNHLVMERYSHRDRVTDLSSCDFTITASKTGLLITANFMTPQGGLCKWYRLEGDKVECGFDFDHLTRPEATIRLGYLTLLNCE